MSTIKESPAVAAASVSSDVPTEYSEAIAEFLKRMGVAQTIKPQHNVDDSFSYLIGGGLKVTSIQRGKISCFLHVKAPILVILSADFSQSIGIVY